MEFDSLLAEARRMSLLPREWADVEAPQVRQILLRSHLFESAALRYVSRQVPIPVHLFLADESRDVDPFLGWGGCLPESKIRVIPVTGTHLSMMSRPHVEALGQALSTAIRVASKEERKGPALEAAG
jgi:thioesterase domain-containing protein